MRRAVLLFCAFDGLGVVEAFEFLYTVCCVSRCHGEPVAIKDATVDSSHFTNRITCQRVIGKCVLPVFNVTLCIQLVWVFDFIIAAMRTLLQNTMRGFLKRYFSCSFSFLLLN